MKPSFNPEELRLMGASDPLLWCSTPGVCFALLHCEHGYRETAVQCPTNNLQHTFSCADVLWCICSCVYVHGVFLWVGYCTSKESQLNCSKTQAK